MSRRVGHLLGCLTAFSCGLLVSAPVQAGVIGRIVHVGYPTSYGHVVRAGSWVPVVVELTLEGQSSFEGALRVEQPDRDGDLASDQVRVQLRGEGTAPRRYVLYCVASSRPGGDTSFSVDLLDGDGNAVEIVSDGKLVQRLKPGQQPEVLVRDEYLILELGRGRKGRIGDLADLETREKYDRPIRVAHLAPDALPDLWLGLEMVDCVVWEQADATELTSAQLDALVAWVHQGGQLLIAAAETADTIAGSKQLAPILPVKIGLVRSLDHLPQLRRLLGAPQGTDEDDDEWAVVAILIDERGSRRRST
ncbi:MAG: hypothetical protein IH835_06270, partial [Proteobacteria bacterium]|nr:hypothetical protein [Pseudomonadota bacterium]